MTRDDWDRWRDDWGSTPVADGPEASALGRSAARRARRARALDVATAVGLPALVGGSLAFGADLPDRIWLLGLLAFFLLLASQQWSARVWAWRPLAEPTHSFLERHRLRCRRRLRIVRAARWLLGVEALALIPLAVERIRHAPADTDPTHRVVAVVIAIGLLVVAAAWTGWLARDTRRMLAAVSELETTADG